MKRVFAVCLLAALAGACLAVAEPPAPTGSNQTLYQGKPLDFWLQQLKDDDALAREEAIGVLGNAGPAAEASLPLLKDLLKNPTATVRLRAAVAVWKISRKGDAATPVLVEALKGTNRAARLTALETLADIGPGAKEALPALQEAMNDPDLLVRQKAAAVLEQMGAAAVPALVERLKDKDPHVRRDSAAALERLGSAAKEAVAGLKDLLADDDKQVRFAAARALLRAEPGNGAAAAVMLDAVKDADPETHRLAAELLLQLRPRPKEAAPAYAALLKDDNLLTRLRAAEALWDADGRVKEVLPVLSNGLKSPDPKLRQRALAAVAHIGPDVKDVLPDLLTLFQAPNFDIGPGTEAFCRIGPTAVPPLMDALTGKNAPTADKARYVLGEMGADAVPALVKQLEQKDGNYRRWAVGILANIGPQAEKAVPALIQIAKEDKDGQLRNSALIALGQIGPRAKAAGPFLLEAHAVGALRRIPLDADAALPVLKEAVKDKNPGMRIAAAAVRFRLDHDGKAAVPVFRELLNDQFNRNQALDELARLGPAAVDAVPDLIDLLTDPDLNTRNGAAKALGRIGPDAKDALPALTKAMMQDKDPFANPEAAAAVVRIGKDAEVVVPALIELLKKPFYPALHDREALTYREALRRYGKEAKVATPALRELLKTPNPSARAAAAEALVQADPAARDAAVQVLTEGLAGGWPANTCAPAAALLRVDPSNARSLPLLIAALSAVPLYDRQEAAQQLALAGPDARAALPALRRMLDDDIPLCRVEAAFAIWKIEGRPAEVVDLLLGWLKDPSSAELRGQAAVLLGQMGAEAKAAAPALREAIEDRSRTVRFHAGNALRKIDPKAADEAGAPDFGNNSTL